MTKDFVPKEVIQMEKFLTRNKSRKRLKVMFLNETLIEENTRNIIAYLLEFLRFHKIYLYCYRK